MPDIKPVRPNPTLLGPINAPSGGGGPITGVGNALAGAAGDLQQFLRARQQSVLRTRIIEFDTEMFSAYSAARRRSDYNPDLLRRQYEAGLDTIRTETNASPEDEAVFSTAFEGFNRIVENENTRRAEVGSRADMLTASLGLSAQFDDALRENPDITLEQADLLAAEMGENIVNPLNPGAADLERTRFYHRAVGRARRVLEQRQKALVQRANLLKELDIDNEIDRIRRLEASGEATSRQAVGLADALEQSVRAIPVTEDSAQWLDRVRNLTVELEGRASADEKARQKEEAAAVALRGTVAIAAQVDLIQRQEASGEITSARALELTDALREEVEKLDLTPAIAAQRDAIRNLATSVSGRIKTQTDRAAAHTAAVSFAQGKAGAERRMSLMENKEYISEEDFKKDVGEFSSFVRGLPEGDPEQIAFKARAFDFIQDRISAFYENTQDRINASKRFVLSDQAATIEQDIRGLKISSTGVLESRLEALKNALTADGAPPGFYENLNSTSTRLRTLYTTITEQQRFQPEIDRIKAAVDTLGPRPTPESVVNLLNARLGDWAESNDLTATEERRFRELAFKQIAPDLETANDAAYNAVFSNTEAELRGLYNTALSAVENREEFDNEGLETTVREVLDALPEEMDRDLRAKVVRPLELKLEDALYTARLKDERDESRTSIEEAAVASGLVVRDNPTTLPDELDNLDNMISDANLDPREVEETKTDARKILLKQSVIGQVRATLTNPTTRTRVPELLEALKTTPEYDALGGELDSIVDDAEREWKQDKDEQSQRLTDERITNIAEENPTTFTEFMSNDATTLPDKARFKSAYETQFSEQLAARDFMDKLVTNRLDKDDQDGYNAWYRLNEGSTNMRNDPTKTLPYIIRAGFMTKEIVRDIWTTVSAGAPEDANKMLGTIAALDARSPDALAASLSREQHSQYVYWKYSRTNTGSIDDLITRVRAFNNEGQTQIRQGREREYTRLSVEAEYASREELSDILDIEDALSDSVGIAYAHRDYVELHRMYYLNGMDWDDAERAARDLVRRDWGENTDGSLMYLPPGRTGVQKLFSAQTGEFDYSWLPIQLANDVRNLGLGGDALTEDTRFLLFADDQTRRERLAGQPVSYLVRYVREDGVIDFVSGEHNLLRYVPKPDKAMQDAQRHEYRAYQNPSFLLPDSFMVMP